LKKYYFLAQARNVECFFEKRLVSTSRCLSAEPFCIFLGHAILEPPCHDKEKLLLGHNTRNKTLIVLGNLLRPVMDLLQASAWTGEALT
jgi:hypothetical protein